MQGQRTLAFSTATGAIAAWQYLEYIFKNDSTHSALISFGAGKDRTSPTSYKLLLFTINVLLFSKWLGLRIVLPIVSLTDDIILPVEY